MNKKISVFIKGIVFGVIFISLIAMGSILFGKEKLELRIKVCYDSADIQVFKCEDYKNGCINPKLIQRVISASPNAQLYTVLTSGIYAITDGREYREILVNRAHNNIYETFGCPSD